MSKLEFLISLIIGVLFLAVGIIAFFPPLKLPWIIRFIIIFVGVGFTLYSILGLFGLVSS
ncbi:glucan phosphoethanolaminetransferase (alkaline phosphatase superfamily) [Alkalibacillus salilacus]|uniref:Glucan phosphoethanolaminetransferase (Alkaline phosphatase superfamily) n=1 Tax=Alkalibacillus salilacus TaxID=284582 RepID=A0ABT9VET2_9BACI|nr:glucan phosphoethanolaminetransferase (alkaline phosphatase superfamily) [Alkalibacillus salilacus]